jgi:DNA-binding response OmpR family regulator
MAFILIVEDDPHISATLALLLQSRGHRVRRAGNGAEGLLAAHADLPDLILMDMAMPILEGSETVKALRHEARTAAIPVVILSALNDDASQARALASGADIYLTKPPHVRDLIVVIERLLTAKDEDGTA